MWHYCHGGMRRVSEIGPGRESRCPAGRPARDRNRILWGYAFHGPSGAARGPSILGRASLYGIARPPSWRSCKALTAAAASPLSCISTKAKPRERPVSRSLKSHRRHVTVLAEELRSSSSLAVSGRLPT